MSLNIDTTTLDSQTFRRIVGHLASGVTVITTVTDGRDAGMTASSVTSLSADPPAMLACLNNGVPTANAVAARGAYVVNVLGESQGDLAMRFATPSANKFAGCALRRTTLGLPVLADAIAFLECRVTKAIRDGTHTIYIGEVISGGTQGGGPLTYFRGGFGRFELAHDNEVCSVRLFDERVSHEAFDARLMLQRYALHKATAPTRDWQPLRRALAQMSSSVHNDRFTDFRRYVEGNLDFHREVIRVGGSSTAVRLYDSLNLRAVLLRSFGASQETSGRFVIAQRRVSEALEAGNYRSAYRLLEDYRDLAKARVTEVLQRTGGFK